MGFLLIKNIVLMMLFISLAMAMVATSSKLGTPNEEMLPGSRWTVHIFNKMIDGGMLVLHCKSKDDDLGIHRVSIDQSFDFSFRENFQQTTLFWCNFASKKGHAEFEVYWPERRHSWLEDHCDGGHCIWTAKDDGIHLRNNKFNVDDYKHNWN